MIPFNNFWALVAIVEREGKWAQNEQFEVLHSLLLAYETCNWYEAISNFHNQGYDHFSHNFWNQHKYVKH